MAWVLIEIHSGEEIVAGEWEGEYDHPQADPWKPEGGHGGDRMLFATEEEAQAYALARFGDEAGKEIRIKEVEDGEAH